MARKPAENPVADLLAQIAVRYQTGPKSNVDVVLEELAGTPLGTAFRAALENRKDFAASAISRFMRDRGYTLVSEQSVSKWRREHDIRA